MVSCLGSNIRGFNFVLFVRIVSFCDNLLGGGFYCEVRGLLWEDCDNFWGIALFFSVALFIGCCIFCCSEMDISRSGPEIFWALFFSPAPRAADRGRSALFYILDYNRQATTRLTLFPVPISFSTAFFALASLNIL